MSRAGLRASSAQLLVASAMLSAPARRSSPMAMLRKEAMALAAVPVRTCEGSSWKRRPTASPATAASDWPQAPSTQGAVDERRAAPGTGRCWLPEAGAASASPSPIPGTGRAARCTARPQTNGAAPLASRLRAPRNGSSRRHPKPSPREWWRLISERHLGRSPSVIGRTSSRPSVLLLNSSTSASSGIRRGAGRPRVGGGSCSRPRFSQRTSSRRTDSIA